MGYVGLPLALLLSEERFRVTGFDIDAEKVTQLNRGESYIRHIEGDHLAMAHQAGFRATTDYAEIAAMDAVLICVPTPLHADHTPDMRAVVHTIESIAPHLLPGQLVILESTTYPGTTEELIVPAINRAGQARGVQVLAPLPASAGVDDARLLDGVMVAFSPEREDPGNMVVPRREVPKVIGGYDARATAAACALYSCIFRSTVPVSSPATAEMTKLLENIYRCVNIALVNEIKLVCEGMGLDVWEVIDAASTKPFGFQPFYPGPGVGGHCIPVDPFYLSWKARQHGHATRFIELAGEVNESMPAHVVQTTSRALKQRGCSLMGARALILGLAYKADVDDLRESPALRIIDLLEQAGARVHYNDPYFPQVGRGRKYDLQMHSTPLSDLGKFDCVLIVTDHSVYNYEQIVDEAKLVIDTRNATRGRRSPKIVRC
ncbi:MAG: nucleotide sugar dehydrogenase [Acidobacteriota bacterium]|nr:nucleotide sugar dehydrogenase [Acidobacteriota bacterium]